MRSSGFHGKGVMGVFKGHYSAPPTGQSISQIHCHHSAVHLAVAFQYISGFCNYACQNLLSSIELAIGLQFTIFGKQIPQTVSKIQKGCTKLSTAPGFRVCFAL